MLDEIIDSTEGNTGIPIGNYLSQYSGNFYFSSFDHWIKEEKQVKYYYRYMDDIVLINEDKNKLKSLLNEINLYFKNNLELTVKDNHQIFPVDKRGIDFLGYRIFKNYVLLRKRTRKRMKKKMKSILNKCDKGIDMTYSEWCSINFYKGWLKYCNSYRLNEIYIKPLNDYSKKFYNNHLRKSRKGDKINDKTYEV